MYSTHMDHSQAPWRCCWRITPERECSSPLWEPEHRGADEADTGSRSTAPTASVNQTSPHRPGCSDSPHNKICKCRRRRRKRQLNQGKELGCTRLLFLKISRLKRREGAGPAAAVVPTQYDLHPIAADGAVGLISIFIITKQSFCKVILQGHSTGGKTTVTASVHTFTLAEKSLSAGRNMK